MSKIRHMTEKQPPSYPLRMPQELREQLAEVAKTNNRSMNAEIVARLEGSFLPAEHTAPQINECMEQLKLKYSRLGVLIAELTSIRQYRMQLRMDQRQDELVVSEEMFADLDKEEEAFSAEQQALRKEIDDLQRLIATKGDERFHLAA